MGRDSITGEFSMMSFGGFPGVVRRPAGKEEEPRLTTIYGETYMMEADALGALDMLESHPNWYERFKYRTDVLDVRAWMYTLPMGKGYLDRTHYDQIPESIWRPTPAELEYWDHRGETIETEADDAA
jgi:gamma-glutamylcyclotransferase (GGCT)/AIG2-like uncharacterized protein YtfP